MRVQGLSDANRRLRPRDMTPSYCAGRLAGTHKSDPQRPSALFGFDCEVDERVVTVRVAFCVDDDIEGLAGGDGGAEVCDRRGLAECEVSGLESGRALIDRPAEAVMFGRAPG